MPAAENFQGAVYRARVAVETGIYGDCVDVHKLPPIFHYWSNRHLRPKLEAFGFSAPNEMFQQYLLARAQRRPREALRFASIGAGNCDLEIALASYLREQGHADFVIDCLEMNPAMLERGRADAVGHGVAEHIRLVPADFNLWTPTAEYDAVLANQSLHHVVNLEGLFGWIKGCLKPQGTFLISDIVGRNGHLRWPEALAIVHEFWRRLPPSYRYNNSLARYEELYENWDCSTESFEGIRAQDILPLLVDQFHFQLFVGFGNVIDPFIDRAFGHNFDVTQAWDRAFIDQVHERDEMEMAAGRIKPTHMIAVVGNEREDAPRFLAPLSPSLCIRLQRHSDAEPGPQASQDAYAWKSWPHRPEDELAVACRRLREAENRLREQTMELAARAAWAQRLDRELGRRFAWRTKLKRGVERLPWGSKLYNVARKMYHGARRLRSPES